MFLGRHIRLAFYAVAAGLFSLPVAVFGQAYVRAGAYNSDCLIRPTILRPEFEKPVHVRTTVMRPEFLRTEAEFTTRERSSFEHPTFVRAQFVRPEYHRCTEKEKSRSGGLHAAGFIADSAAPGAFSRNTAAALPKDGATGAQLAEARRGSSDELNCCSGPFFVPSAAKGVVR